MIPLRITNTGLLKLTKAKIKSITAITMKNIDDIVVNIMAVRSAFGFIPSVNANVIVIAIPETIVSKHLNSSTLHIAYNP